MLGHHVRSWLLLTAFVAGCHDAPAPPADGGAPSAQGNTAPSAVTQAANAAVAKALPLDDPQDLQDAQRGLLLRDPQLKITAADGRVVWDMTSYAFVEGPPPPSVNPSLWRQAKLDDEHGLFQVADGIYQVRGYDVSNLTLIRGQSGWIVVDPLTTFETATAAMALARRQLGEVRVSAVIFTHSHIDHFGGVNAVLPADPAARAAMRIIAPHRFVEEATSENVLAGAAMGRRASFMYGTGLARDARGHVDTGLGKTPAVGSIGFAMPNEFIDHTPQPLDVDGVPFEFVYAPDSEAPAELMFYLPQQKALCGAEVVTHTMHNLYTLRGAKVRDALKWSGYIDDVLQRFPAAEVVFASHHWPVWDRPRVAEYLERQRDTYRYLHDQTLRLANNGFTAREIAEQVELPSSLRTVFANRGYYGTVRHNTKAVYQAYFGWYDANPANLDPLPPEDEGRRYVEAMGGAGAALQKGREAVARGDYRWAATLLNHVVFAEPGNTDAREALAQAYDQLGYQAESGPWRDVYLMGALELRRGIQKLGITPAAMADTLRHLPPEKFFVAMAARLDGTKADGQDTKVNFVFTDLNESWVLHVKNAVLHHRRQDPDASAVATVRLTRDMLVKMVTGQAGLRDAIFSDELSVEGSRIALLSFLSMLDRSTGEFPIVTP